MVAIIYIYLFILKIAPLPEGLAGLEIKHIMMRVRVWWGFDRQCGKMQMWREGGRRDDDEGAWKGEHKKHQRQQDHKPTQDNPLYVHHQLFAWGKMHARFHPLPPDMYSVLCTEITAGMESAGFFSSDGKELKMTSGAEKEGEGNYTLPTPSAPPSHTTSRNTIHISDSRCGGSRLRCLPL
ncbi:hypothetical protein C8J57DRAFT_1242975 [Mycena rebaudengoi]|nr:hypothetical protein C8J57DRAFT_1242975 [Mycena rebaudengoi]